MRSSPASADASAPAGDSPPAEPRPLEKPVTLRTLRRMVESGERFASLTCYDATTARILQAAGVPALLVGDTAAEMILGYPSTIHAPLDFLITLTAAVKRGAPRCFVMGDMPFMSYQADDADALRHAGRFLTEGTADAVKLEVDRSFVPLIEKMARAGVPVVAHLGSRPQRAKLQGGYRAAANTREEVRELVHAARATVDAGAVMLLLEAMPAEAARAVVEAVDVPVIGCGAGPACHGQIVVLQDLLGMTTWQPAFARPLADAGAVISAAAARWIENVRTNSLGEHPYTMRGEDEPPAT